MRFKKSILFCLSLAFLPFSINIASAQNTTNIYCLPGQGADARLFSKLSLDTNRYRIHHIAYGTPQRGQSLVAFAQTLASQIDTTQPFVLLGVSLGGMLCVELSEVLRPERTILIASAKNSRELPFRYRFQRKVPLYKVIPGWFMHASARVLQPIVEPDRRKEKAIFKSMLRAKTPTYMKRSVSMIIGWERTSNTSKIYHIHGTKDHTLPLRNIKHPNRVVQGGSHMMTLTRPSELSKLVGEALAE